MPFPKTDEEFPSAGYSWYMRKIKEWAAWYSGDPEQLLSFYGSTKNFPNTDKGRFWARTEADERADVVHLPIAGDIATTSADLLFSETPIFEYKENEKSGERISYFIKENGMVNTLLEAAEMSAALSGIFLKLDVEPELASIPILSIISPLQAIPYFWRGRLQEVLFFRTVKEAPNRDSVWRLFELRYREGGKLVIDYKLYKGNQDKVGREVGLDSIEETANLELEPVTYNIDGLGCVYIPNRRPNKLIPTSPMGINDYSTVISLMDSLDFAWTSWMRDIELGMAQILVDEELLEKPDGSGDILQDDAPSSQFSKFQKTFVKLNLSPWRMAGDNVKAIEQVQFDIREDEHLKTCESLLYQIVTQCGYNPQTFGIVEQGSRAESGTALRIRERKSLLTREKKSRYWMPALWSLFWQMQQLDIESNLASQYEPQEVDVVLQDSVVTDERERSEVIKNLDQAKAASTFVKVKLLHPEWDEEQIEQEVDRILKDQGMGPMPFEEEEGEV